LEWIFTYIFYPIIVIGMFIVIWGHIYFIVVKGSNHLAMFRRSVGSLLPLVILVFIMTTSPTSNSNLAEDIKFIPAYVHVFAGVVLGVSMIECGKIASKTSYDAGAAIYALFASTIGSFLLYCFMKGALGSLNNFLLSFLVAGGLYIIFHGFDELE
jgi:hypothetical protein